MAAKRREKPVADEALAKLSEKVDEIIEDGAEALAVVEAASMLVAPNIGQVEPAPLPTIARIYLTSPVSIPGQRKTEAVAVARSGAGIRCESIAPEMLGPIAGFALHFSSGDVRFVPATSVALVELG